MADLWDGVNLKCTFRICVDSRLLNLWEEVVQIASEISFSEEEDSLVWQLSQMGFIHHSLCMLLLILRE